MDGEFNLNQGFFCWHLILCKHNVDMLDICIKKVDVLKLSFDKMAAFLTFNCFFVGVSNKDCLIIVSFFIFNG